MAAQKSGRLLQNLDSTKGDGFVADVSSRAFQDETGVFAHKLNLLRFSEVIALFEVS
jgi:hypothetical protein